MRLSEAYTHIPSASRSNACFVRSDADCRPYGFQMDVHQNTEVILCEMLNRNKWRKASELLTHVRFSRAH